jgi:outer membrane protein assembly factor BamB
VDGGTAYVTGCDALFRALRIADGKELFRISSGAYTGASPALSNGRAYYGTFENEVIAVDLGSRKVLWRYKPERQFPFYSSAAVAGGKVVLGGRDKVVHALDAATGKAAWTFTTRARVDSSPAVAGGKVCVGSGDGRIYVLDLARGTKLEEFDAASPVSASPAVADGRIVLGTQDGQVLAFGAKG